MQEFTDQQRRLIAQRVATAMSEAFGQVAAAHGLSLQETYRYPNKFRSGATHHAFKWFKFGYDAAIESLLNETRRVVSQKQEEQKGTTSECVFCKGKGVVWQGYRERCSILKECLRCQGKGVIDSAVQEIRTLSVDGKRAP